MICGVGTCTNNLNGGFYFCTCPDGYEATGMASELEENCTGTYTYMYVNIIHWYNYAYGVEFVP